MRTKTSDLKNWILPIALVASTWGLDQLSKSAIRVLGQPVSFGPFGLSYHLNPGLMLGLFSHLPASLRVVGLSTLSAFLLFCFVTVLYFLPARILGIRLGLALLLGGILGNITDRAGEGAVVDFIFLRLGSVRGFAFNLADLLQWVGYVLVGTGLFRHSETLWPSRELRNTYLVNRSVQLKFSFKVLVAALSFAATLGTLTYTYFKLVLTSPQLSQPEFQETALKTFVWMAAWVSLGFSVFLFLLSVLTLHRIAGPIHAFKRHLNAVIRGERPKFRLRERDQFKDLELLGEQVSEAFSSRPGYPRRADGRPAGRSSSREKPRAAKPRKGARTRG